MGTHDELKNKGGLEPVGPAPIALSDGDLSEEMEPASTCVTYSLTDQLLQDETRFTANDIQRLTNTLSAARLRRYVKLAHEDTRLGLRLYHWNAALAGSLLPVLHIAEVSVRNFALQRLRAKYGVQWYRSTEFLDRRLGSSSLAEQLKRAYEDELERGRVGDLSNYITSELTFGFWVNIYTSKFHPHLWHRPLHTMLPTVHRGMDINGLHGEVEFVRSFRNNVAHHKDLVEKPVFDNFNRTIRLIEAYSKQAAVIAKEASSFERVYASRPT